MKVVSVYQGHNNNNNNNSDDNNNNNSDDSEEVSQDFTLPKDDDLEAAAPYDDRNNPNTSTTTPTAHLDICSVGGSSSTTLPRYCCGSATRRRRRRRRRSPTEIAIMIALLGTGAAAAFLVLGILSAAAVTSQDFAQAAVGLVQQIHMAYMDYEVAALWTHQACTSQQNMTHVEFRELYEQIASTGIDVQIEFLPYVAHADRPLYEQRMQTFVNEYYPHVDYQGFVGLEPVPNTTELDLLPRSVAPFYYPIHYMEPIPGSEAALDLDVYSRPRAKFTIDKTLETWKPALSEPARLVEETEDHASAVFLFHPGTPLSTQPALQPRDLSLMVIRIPDLLQRATRGWTEATEIFLYDTSTTTTTTTTTSSSTSGSGGNGSMDEEKRSEFFLGHVKLHVARNGQGDEQTQYELLPPVSLQDIRRTTRLYQEHTITIADRQWTIATIALPGTFEPHVALVWVGGVLLFLCSCAVAAWVFSKLRYSDMRRAAKLREYHASAAAERTALILENANKATRAERTLNDFIAHEVRNPIAAAMAACSFIRTEVFSDEPLRDAAARQSVQEDVQVLDNSLNFVNDLLRNMLDMHRANSRQLHIETQLVDVYNDVLKPVDSMLYRRGSDIQVVVDCEPPDLVIQTDLLRLKQVLLNLGRNASKFVESGGFIKLSARVVNGMVQLSVADSGKGIPVQKRHRLFEKFQESLDSLSQGTGIGLSLCKSLVQLMGGEICLDETYQSGIEGYPGTRFVIDLYTAPVVDVDITDETTPYTEERDTTSSNFSDEDTDHPSKPGEGLPENLSVLFVDDDMVIRRLFCRALSIVAPTWKVQQACNGETALQMVRQKGQESTLDAPSFDLIFLDQYMASVEKQLLGTETARELRANGFTGCICGLSANDIEAQFFASGANAFMMKPFPAQKDLLQVELQRVLSLKSPIAAAAAAAATTAATAAAK